MTNETTERLTHNLHLWIFNDEGMLEQLADIAKAQELDLYDTANAIKDYFRDEDLWDDYSKLNSIHRELLDIALAFIDWQDLAKDIIEMIEEEAKAE